MFTTGLEVGSNLFSQSTSRNISSERLRVGVNAHNSPVEGGVIAGVRGRSAGPNAVDLDRRETRKSRHQSKNPKADTCAAILWGRACRPRGGTDFHYSGSSLVEATLSYHTPTQMASVFAPLRSTPSAEPFKTRPRASASRTRHTNTRQGRGCGTN